MKTIISLCLLSILSHAMPVDDCQVVYIDAPGSATTTPGSDSPSAAPTSSEQPSYENPANQTSPASSQQTQSPPAAPTAPTASPMSSPGSEEGNQGTSPASSGDLSDLPDKGSMTWYKKEFNADMGYATTACGTTSQQWSSSKIPLVAMSENYFGTGDGGGAGPACGKCVKITPTQSLYGPEKPEGAGSIIAKVADLCPDGEGAPSEAGGYNAQWCKAKKGDLNDYKVGVHVDIMEESLKSADVNAWWKKGKEGNTNYFINIEPVACP